MDRYMLKDIRIECPQCAGADFSLNTELIYSVNLYQKMQGALVVPEHQKYVIPHREDSKSFLSCRKCGWLSSSVVWDGSDVTFQTKGCDVSDLYRAHWSSAIASCVNEWERGYVGKGKLPSKPKMSPERKAWRKRCRDFLAGNPKSEQVSSFLHAESLTEDKMKDFNQLLRARLRRL